MSRATYRSTARVALVTASVLLLALLANGFTDGEGWSLADFVVAGVLLAGTGLLLELAARNPRSVALRALTAAIGVGAIVFGEADDAPGLVLFGLLLLAGTVALAARTAQRSR